MRVGAMLFCTDQSIQPVPFGEALEERGFDSVWFPEHSHIPVSRVSPWGGRVGAPPLPEWYWRTHDQLIALAAIAGRTERLKLATGISLVAQRDPIWLAKQIASLDVISGGRVLFGVGYGWNREEMATHGVDFRTRRRLVHEKLRAMRALWTDDVASFEGEFLSIEPSWAWPKPAQTPHPPIFFGGSARPDLFTAVAELGSGWAPLARITNLEDSIAELRDVAGAAGRDPSEIEIAVFQAQPTPERVERWIDAGVDLLIVDVPSAPPDAVIEVLDGYVPLLRDLG
jgi:probable F420-dependent oxidoreductase